MTKMTAEVAAKMADDYVVPNPNDVLMKGIDKQIERAAAVGNRQVILRYKTVDSEGYWTNQLPQNWKKSVAGNLRERGFTVQVHQSSTTGTPRNATIDVSW